MSSPRLAILLAALMGAHRCFAAPPLPDLHQAPSPPLTTPLTPLLKNSDRAQWENQREFLRQEWTRVLGQFPAQKVPLATEFLEREELATFSRQKLTYQIEEGVRIDAMLLVPKGAQGPMPTIVLFHPTYANHYKRVVGLEGAEEPERQQAIQWVEAGYVVLAPRCFLWNELPPDFQKKGENLYVANVRFMQQTHPTWTGLTRMTWDGIRALDLAQSLPIVDSSRIGIFGHSLGAKEVLYLAAFDSRPKCIISSEGGIGTRQSNWQEVWYLGPQIQQPTFQREHHELLALIAPRPFLLLAGGEAQGAADSDLSWPLIEAALPVYQLFNAQEKLGWFKHGLGHRYGAQARPVAEAFFERFLK